MEFVTILHHSKDEDADCGGDYWHVTVEFEGKEIARFGDWYHDKGEDKADAFIDGVIYALTKEGTATPDMFSRKLVQVADAEY